jgi:hypothetical protein
LFTGYITFKIIAILSSLAFLTRPTWVFAANDLTTPNHFSDIFEP